MPIQLDKILADIAEEKTLHPNYPTPSKKQMDEAWMRVGKKNKLSVHECRSIFKVLQKKYEQERLKDSSSWKLFSVMDEIHKKIEVKTEIKHEKDPEVPTEEDEEYEMLEVQEEEDHPTTAALPSANAVGGAHSEGDSPNKSMKSNSSMGSPEKDEKPFSRNQPTAPPSTLQEERKLLNALPTTAKMSGGSTAAAAMQKKGITLRKAMSSTMIKTGTAVGHATKTTTGRSSSNSILEIGRTMQLPESIKRKLSEDQPSHQPTKRSSLSQTAVAAASTAQLQQQQQQISANNSGGLNGPGLAQIKQERDDDKPATAEPHGISVITIPSNLTNGAAVGCSGGPSSSAAATVASNSTNGYSPRLEELDFRNEIIFDSGHGQGGGINGVIGQQSVSRVNHHATSEIINLGNFDNSLPPTFFKNLCNSARHEALGLYVANVMNRLGTRAAAKLELGILRAIIDVQSDELEQ